ncbi:MAG: hypothetical protein QW594_04360, partial [Candidatus Woesearchaeota archaeon]
MFKNQDSGNATSVNKKKLKQAFSLIKEELQEHLDAINENTNEIQYVHEQVELVKEKIEKLTSRLDELELLLGMQDAAIFQPTKRMHAEHPNQYPQFSELSRQEKEVFLLLYEFPKG